MKFDIPGPHPRKAVLYRDNKERVYDLPFNATDPDDIEALSSVPGIQVVPALVAQVAADLVEAGLTPKEAEAAAPGVIDLALYPDPKPKRPSRKEV